MGGVWRAVGMQGVGGCSGGWGVAGSRHVGCRWLCVAAGVVWRAVGMRGVGDCSGGWGVAGSRHAEAVAVGVVLRAVGMRGVSGYSRVGGGGGRVGARVGVGGCSGGWGVAGSRSWARCGWL